MTFYPRRKTAYTACPICGDTGLVHRPSGWQGNDKPVWSPCAAGPPWHATRAEFTFTKMDFSDEIVRICNDDN